MNIDDIFKNNLTISEYLYLRNLFVGEDNKIKNLYKLIENINEDSLQERGFIKITEDAIILRSKAIDMFLPKDLFYTFLSTFPIKTPNGRYLSPSGSGGEYKGMAVDKLRKKWDSLFRNKENLQKNAIDVLNAEIKWRKKTGNIEYMNASETWLNQANFEKYAYLLEDNNKEINKEKWM